MPVQYRDVKVPEPIYESARILRQRTIEFGLNQIPREITSPAKCPLCHGPLEGFQAAYQYMRCSNCGYSQQQLVAQGSGALGLGVIIGLGLAALANLMSESESSRHPRRRSRNLL